MNVYYSISSVFGFAAEEGQSTFPDPFEHPVELLLRAEFVPVVSGLPVSHVLPDPLVEALVQARAVQQEQESSTCSQKEFDHYINANLTDGALNK